MGRPSKGYFCDECGARCVGTTTCTGLTTPPRPMTISAVKLTREGKDYEAEWGRKRVIGTLLHDMIEYHYTAGDPKMKDVWTYEENRQTLTAPQEWVKAARQAFENFTRWVAGFGPWGFTPWDAESVEVPLTIHPEHLGGTPDIIASIHKTCALVDFKTGRLYGEHLFQLGLYTHLIESRTDRKIERYELARFDIETGAFKHASWQREAIEPFIPAGLNLLRVYRDVSRAQKMVR